MQITMGKGEQSVFELRRFLESSEAWEFKAENRASAYEWLQKELVRCEYLCRDKKERGVIRSYLEKVTGISVSQTTRLIGQYRRGGRIERRTSGRNRFVGKYTDQDIALLAATDLAHERLSGPATCRILKREWEVFGQPEYERLAGISPSHLYNLRGGKAYQKRAGAWGKTRSSGISIGERKRPEPRGKPGYLRVDTVHQGEREKRKGVYHINAADAVTQWEIVGCTEQISEAWVIPVLEAILHQFPFRIEGFHSDNGSEFVNRQVAGLLNNLLIEFTKSRANRTTDNALIEGKNGAIVRKHMGYEYIAGEHAERVQKFYTAHLNHYLNYHRPCGFATVTLDARGKRRRVYKAVDYATPYEKLRSLPEAAKYLKEGITFEKLDRIANRMSDTECARRLRERKYQLLSACHGVEGELPKW